MIKIFGLEIKHTTPLSSLKDEAMEVRHEPFYLQKINVSKRFEGMSRIDIFSGFVKNSRVLHIGCTQYPITNINTSIHIKLSSTCSIIDGYDVDQAGYEVLRPHVMNGRFLKSLTEANEYDYVLIPEVIEHVGDVATFLNEMNEISTSHFIITAPDVVQCYKNHFEIKETSSPEEIEVIEAVHPDHNYWFTPYTLCNVINKYTNWIIEGVYWINKISVMVVCRKPTIPSPA